MSPPDPNVHRHDKRSRALITLSGEIDLTTTPWGSASLREHLCGGMRTFDADLAAVASCDVSGLNALLHAASQATRRGKTLRLHHPPLALPRIPSHSDSALLLGDVPASHRASTPTPWPPLSAGAP
ncbi:STAS domain-containing protein [Streptomyces chrestomyceticus]|uniref:STAS domain-containing protein n=1 Tax=Streptomyces chrestomyceticus TaxID=68185 RepID=A0ABU7X343_9ACTN